MRTVKAHGAGPKIITPDGTVTHGGVCVVKLRSDRKTLLTGGADGHIFAWNVGQTVGWAHYPHEITPTYPLQEITPTYTTCTHAQTSNERNLGEAAHQGRGALRLRPLRWTETISYT
jgi:hypothetical protein